MTIEHSRSLVSVSFRPAFLHLLHASLAASAKRPVQQTPTVSSMSRERVLPCISSSSGLLAPSRRWRSPVDIRLDADHSTTARPHSVLWPDSLAVTRVALPLANCGQLASSAISLIDPLTPLASERAPAPWGLRWGVEQFSRSYS